MNFSEIKLLKKGNFIAVNTKDCDKNNAGVSACKELKNCLFALGFEQSGDFLAAPYSENLVKIGASLRAKVIEAIKGGSFFNTGFSTSAQLIEQVSKVIDIFTMSDLVNKI